jgi:hypothetical protein
MKRFFGIAIVLILSITAVYAADSAAHNVVVQIQNVCKINLNSTSTITLTTVAPAVGGNAVTGQTDSSKLLQYTSAAPTGQTRRITAAWGGSDSAPAGTALRRCPDHSEFHGAEYRHCHRFLRHRHRRERRRPDVYVCRHQHQQPGGRQFQHGDGYLHPHRCRITA